MFKKSVRMVSFFTQGFSHRVVGLEYLMSHTKSTGLRILLKGTLIGLACAGFPAHVMFSFWKDLAFEFSKPILAKQQRVGCAVFCTQHLRRNACVTLDCVLQKGKHGVYLCFGNCSHGGEWALWEFKTGMCDRTKKPRAAAQNLTSTHIYTPYSHLKIFHTQTNWNHTYKLKYKLILYNYQMTVQSETKTLKGINPFKIEVSSMYSPSWHHRWMIS